MFAACVLGTNLGDLWAEDLLPGRFSSLAFLMAVCVGAALYDRRAAGWTEAGYWVAIVVMRAAATNLADIFTHDLRLGYLAVSFVLFGMTAVLAWFTRPDVARGGAPVVDGLYWAAMFVAGLFGTVAGDLIHHSIGLYVASGVLCALLVGLIGVRGWWRGAPILLYWAIVMAERLAGTAVGDMLDSRRALGLGLPLASLCSGVFLVLALWGRGGGLPRWGSARRA
jgi:uncharacterized membrane-anchored protein